MNDKIINPLVSRALKQRSRLLDALVKCGAAYDNDMHKSMIERLNSLLDDLRAGIVERNVIKLSDVSFDMAKFSNEIHEGVFEYKNRPLLYKIKLFIQKLRRGKRNGVA
tara:strand:+ start:7 stop:333 length:327 start_codon:yes stop_codon:yes gene_type:complete